MYSRNTHLGCNVAPSATQRDALTTRPKCAYGKDNLLLKKGWLAGWLADGLAGWLHFAYVFEKYEPGMQRNTFAER